jgi:hypothetical protein
MNMGFADLPANLWMTVSTCSQRMAMRITQYHKIANKIANGTTLRINPGLDSGLTAGCRIPAPPMIVPKAYSTKAVGPMTITSNPAILYCAFQLATIKAIRHDVAIANKQHDPIPRKDRGLPVISHPRAPMGSDSCPRWVIEARRSNPSLSRSVAIGSRAPALALAGRPAVLWPYFSNANTRFQSFLILITSPAVSPRHKVRE